MPSRKVAYLSLQAVVDGQDTWAAVMEVVRGWRDEGWIVDTYFPQYAAGSLPGPLGRLAEMRRVMKRLGDRLSEYDAVYVRAHPFAYPLVRRATAARVPVVHESNGPYEDLFIAWPATRVARPVFEAMQRWQYRHAAAIVSVADGLTRWLIREAGHDRVYTNGNGANVEAFSPSAPRREGLPERYAVFFGMFPPWQGIGALLQAVRLAAWPAGVPLVFAGDGAMRQAVERAAAELPERVHYLGRLPYEEVAGVAAHAMASFVPMVMPERETMFSPLKLYESMACGVPVIATDVVGITEVVSEFDCGLLVAPGDARGLAEALAALATDPDLAAEMGARGRAAAVERFSWLTRARERAGIVERAIAGAGR
jgi:glycosyltransferase involved in cell wall biosynthesis